MNRQIVDIPNYCFKTHKRLSTTTRISPSDIIFFEGIFALCEPRINDLMTYKIFVHCDDDIRLSRRILRDVTERGRDPQGIIEQYNRFVKPSYIEFIKPCIDFADLIVPGGKDNTVSIKFIVQNLKNILKEIGKIKEYIKSTLFFHGDKMEDFWLVPQVKEINMNSMFSVYMMKQLIFEKNDFNKKQIRYFMDQFTEEFNYQFLRKCMRFYFKLALKLFVDTIKERNLNLEDVDFSGQDDTKKAHCVLVPWIVAQQQTVSQQYVKNLQDKYPNKEIYVVNIFASVR